MNWFNHRYFLLLRKKTLLIEKKNMYTATFFFLSPYFKLSELNPYNSKRYPVRSFTDNEVMMPNIYEFPFEFELDRNHPISFEFRT
jgi:hypothetical protein